MNWKIIPTGRVWVDPGGALGLVPKALWKNFQPTDNLNRVPMDLNSLLIETDEGKLILVDSGLGTKLSERAVQNWGLEYPEGSLLDNLLKEGVAREDISMVLNTHLHSDHCGGNTIKQDGEIIPTFPNAEYWVQRIEFADAMHPDERTRGTYLAENITPVWQNDQFRFMQGNLKITENITCVVTPGHTRGLQCIILEQPEKPPAMFMTDLTSFALHMMKTGWVTAYDVFPLETIKTKKIWQKWAIENQATLIFQHDIITRVGKLSKDDRGKFGIKTKIAGSESIAQQL